MTIGIRRVRNKIRCHGCNEIITEKYYYTKIGKGMLKYCEKCGKTLMDFKFYNREEGKKYGIERRI